MYFAILSNTSICHTVIETLDDSILEGTLGVNYVELDSYDESVLDGHYTGSEFIRNPDPSTYYFNPELGDWAKFPTIEELQNKE
jgi:hypothetical protein